MFGEYYQVVRTAGLQRVSKMTPNPAYQIRCVQDWSMKIK